VTAQRNGFAARVGGILATRVVQFGLAILTSILISRLLGPSDKGAYVAVTTVPGLLAAIGVLGLPSAVNYFAGRGHAVASLIRATVVFTALLSIVLVGLVWIVRPILEASVLRAAPDALLQVILLTVPASLIATFGGSLLYGRQTIRVYNMILIFQAGALLAADVVLVWVLGLGVEGAVAATVLVSVLTALAVLVEVRRLRVRDTAGPAVGIRSLLSYGTRLYPASLTGYFNYRADTYLIQALLAIPGRALGLYSLAVTMAELVFYVPDSVSTMLLPRVAASTAEEADRFVGQVGRVTMLITVTVAIILVPVAFLGVYVVLPAYTDCLTAFLVLLPGVVALSVAKVMTSYLSGRGRPGLVSIGSLAALVANIAINIVVIPTFGIVGASFASLVSYSFQAALMVALASHLSGQVWWRLFLPGSAEVVVVRQGIRRAIAGLAPMSRIPRLGSR